MKKRKILSKFNIFFHRREHLYYLLFPKIRHQRYKNYEPPWFESMPPDMRDNWVYQEIASIKSEDESEDALETQYLGI